MLYLSLVPSAILVIAAIGAARRAPHQVRFAEFVTIGFCVSAFPTCIMLVMPVVWLLALLLLSSLVIWRLTRHRVRSYLPLAGAAFVAAYLVGSIQALRQRNEIDRLRERFPVESMESRAPSPVPHDPFPTTTAGWVYALDDQVEEAEWSRQQRHMLRRLHENTTRDFVNSFGFGFGRMGFIVPTESSLTPPERESLPSQPEWPPTTDHAKPPSAVVAARPDFEKWHATAILDFVNPAGFGAVIDRQHVIGFQPHRFSRVPEPVQRWRVLSIELVGILTHPKPVVYMSDSLPTMEHQKTAPTRSLDSFESAGLDAAHKGQDLSSAEDDQRLRVFGAIRNGRRCATCHGGEVGDLLGAFSYTLRVNPR